MIHHAIRLPCGKTHLALTNRVQFTHLSTGRVQILTAAPEDHSATNALGRFAENRLLRRKSHIAHARMDWRNRHFSFASRAVRRSHCIYCAENFQPRLGKIVTFCFYREEYRKFVSKQLCRRDKFSTSKDDRIMEKMKFIPSQSSLSGDPGTARVSQRRCDDFQIFIQCQEPKAKHSDHQACAVNRTEERNAHPVLRLSILAKKFYLFYRHCMFIFWSFVVRCLFNIDCILFIRVNCTKKLTGKKFDTSG